MRLIKLVLIFFFPLTALTQTNSVTIDSLMQAEFHVNHFNGNVLVAEEGRPIFQKSFGYDNYNSKELLDNNSVFELASLSKQFTAAGILLLVQKGRLFLTDTLRKFFPELPYTDVTIQQMLTHTSGLPD